ncbi:hypothetical protein [Sporichthya polymorpha]|uniref:hypothetical protein n=1 Tax=Sporichthya polymorpha TaxID=35751 RepID=UPI00036252CC|nr:hypothetical protein [Sporichthya polymorpha]
MTLPETISAPAGLPARARDWLDVDLPRLLVEFEAELETRPVRVADLLADDAALLRGWAARMREAGTTDQAAATYVAGWFPGSAGRIVGVGLGAAGAGLLLSAGAVRWNVAADEGWPLDGRIDDIPVLVPPGHPWAGQDGVETVAEDELFGRTVENLIAFAAPLIEACKTLGPVSRSSLWDEVADGVACAFNYQPRPLDAAAMERLRRAVGRPGVPWKGRPRLANADSAVLGPVHVAQKGGCCLAFTCAQVDPDESTLTDRERAWRARFPLEAKKRYCATCKFRDPADSVARQVYWLELEHAES